ncbi:hypothetical protein TYRP_008662, partial [Tyrophagus putrescentiae]
MTKRKNNNNKTGGDESPPATVGCNSFSASEVASELTLISRKSGNGGDNEEEGSFSHAVHFTEGAHFLGINSISSRKMSNQNQWHPMAMGGGNEMAKNGKQIRKTGFASVLKLARQMASHSEWLPVLY